MTVSALSKKAEAAARRVQDDPSMHAIRDALEIARAAAASGDRLDQGRVVGLLSLAHAYCDDDAELTECVGEAIARTTLLAEDGCPLSKALLPTLVRVSPREGVRLSMKHYIALKGKS